MEAHSTVTTAPLNKLTLSPRNVRKTVVQADVDDIAESIAVRGVMQNLIVSPSATRRGFYEVDAGGIRFRALEQLLAAKRIKPTYPVPIRIIASEEALATSLIENVTRTAMNPAEEIEAFRDLRDEHPDEADPVGFIARKTGKSRDLIEQRLRLARLPAPILDALRGGAIGISAANAYGSVDDAELQLQAFRVEEARFAGDKHRPINIRGTLQGRTAPASSSRAVYVGLDAYVAAGGRTSRDLFMGADAGEQLHDIALLDRLAREKAEAELPRQVARDQFADGVLMKSFADLPTWPAAPTGYKLGGQVEDVASQSAKPSFVVRDVAIGIYHIVGRGLSPVGWFVPIAAARAPAPASAMPETEHDYGDRPDSARTVVPIVAIDAAVPPAHLPGHQLRDRALELVAARIAAQHLVGESFADRAQWPNEKHGFVPPMDTAIGDYDTILVTVQIRVPRADVEAHLGEAKDQIEADQAANDLATSTDGDPELGGGRLRPTFLGSRR